MRGRYEESVIKDIFHGFRGHIETMNMPKENNENATKICDTYNELEKNLSPDLLKLHQKFVDALEGDWSQEVDFYFIEGFKLGLLIGIECLE